MKLKNSTDNRSMQFINQRSLCFAIHPNGGWRLPTGLSEWVEGENNMQSIRNRFAQENPALNEILLYVLRLVHGGFGIYADAVLIAIHPDQASADAHCQRLINQQVQG